MSIYVAGPVLRAKSALPKWVNDCYAMIDSIHSWNSRFKARLPFGEPTMEGMDDKGFADEISRRISASDSVIAVFLPDDTSTPIECVIAALLLKKRVLLIHERGTAVPRMLSGLKGVKTIDHGPTTFERIQLFLLRSE